jgi:tripartite-type tricarboxylate transporter receptor subunit TctC
LLLTPVVVPVLAPLVFSKLPYNPSTDFAPVAQIATFQFSLSVNAAHPAKNVPELINWMKANPAQANFGSPAPGSLPHFFGVMISTGANIDMVHVPFNGGAPLMNAVAGSQVSTGIDALVDQIEMHRAGKTRILATSGAKRSPLLPDVPTFAESGLKNVEGAGWLGLYATGKTPTATVNALNAAANKALSQTELRERFIKVGLEPTGGSAQDLADIMKRDTERWSPVVKASGFKAD